MFVVFAFDLGTCNVENQLCCEAYEAGVYHINCLIECFNRGSTEKQLEMERKTVHVFGRENNNPVLGMIIFVVINYKGKPKTITNKCGEKIVSSSKYQMVGHNASGFDNYIVSNSLPKSSSSINIRKSTRGLIKLSFEAGSLYLDDREIPKHMKFVGPNCQIAGSLKDIQKE